MGTSSPGRYEILAQATIVVGEIDKQDNEIATIVYITDGASTGEFKDHEFERVSYSIPARQQLFPELSDFMISFNLFSQFFYKSMKMCFSSIL